MPKAFERSGMRSLYDFYDNQFLHFDENKPIKPINRYVWNSVMFDWLSSQLFLKAVTRARDMFVNYRFSTNRAPAVGSANSMTPCSSRHCSMRRSLGDPVGLRSCLRSQNLTALSSTPSAAPSVRWVRPAKTLAARSWRPVMRLNNFEDIYKLSTNRQVLLYLDNWRFQLHLRHIRWPTAPIRLSPFIAGYGCPIQVTSAGIPISTHAGADHVWITLLVLSLALFITTVAVERPVAYTAQSKNIERAKTGSHVVCRTHLGQHLSWR